MNDKAGNAVKAVFFDIDGTLISFRNHTMPESTRRALHALRERGIRLYVATGRSKMMMPFMDSYFRFDAYLTLNGQYCYGDTGVIRKKTIDPAEIATLKSLLAKRPFPCLFVRENDMFLNYADESVEALCRLIDHPVPPVAPLDRIGDGDILQFVPFLKDGEEGFLAEALTQVEMTRSVPYCFDVLPAGGGKDVGMEAVLRQAGISPEETMAFGDGFNDMGMLSYAGIGVAMGNAHEQVRQKADFVTESVDDDGILHALRHFGVLP